MHRISHVCLTPNWCNKAICLAYLWMCESKTNTGNNYSMQAKRWLLYYYAKRRYCIVVLWTWIGEITVYCLHSEIILIWLEQSRVINALFEKKVEFFFTVPLVSHLCRCLFLSRSSDSLFLPLPLFCLPPKQITNKQKTAWNEVKALETHHLDNFYLFSFICYT